MKKAFTLAEVLITLMIIGVIAAITIPSVYWTVQKTDLTAKFAKVYSSLAQCVKGVESLEGNVTQWTWSNGEQVFNDYFSKKFSVIEKCLPGAEGCGDAQYTYLNGASVSNPFPTSLLRFVTADGTKWLLGINSGCLDSKEYCALIRVDINGDSKPNVYGRDVFTFFILPYTNEVRVEGMYDYPTSFDVDNGWAQKTRSVIDGDCSKDGGGTLCGAKIIKDGYKMNY